MSKWVHTCNTCSRTFESDISSESYCSHACENNKSNNTSGGMWNPSAQESRTANEAGNSIVIPGMFLIVGAYSLMAMRDWENFETPTKQILHVYYYIFYKPMYFGVTIYEWVDSVWIVNFAVSGFYVCFLLIFYFAIFHSLKYYGLKYWRWLILFAPIISFFIFTFIPDIYEIYTSTS